MLLPGLVVVLHLQQEQGNREQQNLAHRHHLIKAGLVAQNHHQAKNHRQHRKKVPIAVGLKVPPNLRTPMQNRMTLPINLHGIP